jgi:alkylation response protein AidB-like acyl-CoA dehydrogenase
VLLEHSLRGYTAVTVNPAAIALYLRGNGEWGSIELPGGIQPEEWDAFHDLVCIDEIARCGYLGVIWALGCGDAIGLPPVINFGTEEQKRRFLPGVLRGQERFCLGVTEPDGMAQDKCFQMDKDAVLTEDSWLRCG